MELANDGTVLDIQGARIPRLGFGTWLLEGDDAYAGVRDALEIGYRHIDTARAYENEQEVGRAIADSGLDRGELWITTKIWTSEFAAGDLERAAEDSLRKLRVDHVDLLLLHWPNPEVALEESLGALARLREDGRIGHAGVSNFPAGMLQRALEVAPLLADQVEYHPFLAQDALLEVCAANELTLTAYSPLAHGAVPKDPDLTQIGAVHGKTAGQVALRWLLDQPLVTTAPKASSHDRRLENFEVFDFALTDEDRARIAALPKDRRRTDPPWAPDWDA
jgi:diketogulonate reductase-like aldo/keto reductase